METVPDTTSGPRCMILFIIYIESKPFTRNIEADWFTAIAMLPNHICIILWGVNHLILKCITKAFLQIPIINNNPGTVNILN